MVLDIGGDCGALVVWMPASLDGTELELRPVGASWQGRHTAVRPRDLGIGRRLAAVFGTLEAGRYQLRVQGSDTPPVTDVEVVGGAIAETTWPAHAGPVDDPDGAPSAERLE